MADIRLMYQPTSWEYIQFLALANDGSNAFLADEGANLLEAWLNTGMAEPHVMAAATWGDTGGGCSIIAPTLLLAEPGDKQATLGWQALANASDLAGYRLYFDQNGKSQPVADLPCTADVQEACTSYTHTGLTNGQQYCYEVTAYTASCESGFSNILCVTPTQPGQVVAVGVADPLTTGKWVTEGKGKNATTTFVVTAEFLAGDEIVIRSIVRDEAGNPVPDATVSLAISGPELAELVSGPSDVDGIAESAWNTRAPNKRGSGATAQGNYTVTVTAVTASGYTWDGVSSSTTFTLGL